MKITGNLTTKQRATTGIKVRPFNGSFEEYEALVRIENANHPDALQTVKEWQFREKTRDQKYLYQRIVAEQEGRIVAHGVYGETWWSYKPGRFFIALGVDPFYQGIGIAEMMYDAVLADLKQLEADSMFCEVCEDQNYIIELLAAKNFQEVLRLLVSRLQIDLFAEERFADICQQVEESGIWIGSLRELLKTDPEWQYKLWNLEWEIHRDVPTADPLTRMDFDFWAKRVFGSPNFTLDGVIVAKDGEQLVGLSSLWLSDGDPHRLGTGLTGTVRSYRRRGIATAMKVRAIQFARRYGAQVIETDNEEHNPMYKLNLKLGFKPAPALIQFKKWIKTEETFERAEKQTITAFT